MSLKYLWKMNNSNLAFLFLFSSVFFFFFPKPRDIIFFSVMVGINVCIKNDLLVVWNEDRQVVR